MTQTTDPPKKGGLLVGIRLPPHKLLPITDGPLSEYFPTSMMEVELAKISEIANLLWFPANLSEGEKHAQLIKAIDLLDSINPRDGLEGMLALQMVGTHLAVLECLRRASARKESFEARNADLGHAQRLMSLYAKQLAALDKYRGYGQKSVKTQQIKGDRNTPSVVGPSSTAKTSKRSRGRRKVAPR